MKQESFAMPWDGWNGLHAPQYIVRAYRLKFEPTAEAVKRLNRGDAIASHPQGLVFMLGVGTYIPQSYEHPHGDIFVIATDEAYFEKYAESALAAMEEEVNRIQHADTVRQWYSE